MASTTFTSQGPSAPAIGLHMHANSDRHRPRWVREIEKGLVARYGDRVSRARILEQLHVAVEAVLAFGLPKEEQQSTAAAIARHRLAIAVGDEASLSRL